MEALDKEFMWAEKYRPQKVDDVIIPARIKTGLMATINSGQAMNMTFFSPSPGTGKTTTAFAICNSLGIRPLYINASLNTSVDTIRMQVTQYATTVSVMGARGGIKVVILDEADRLSPQAQDSLKGVIDASSANCRFILTVNNIQRVVDPILSRCPVVDFMFTPEENKQVMALMHKRCTEILTAEGVKFTPSVVAQMVKRYSPDNRALLNRLQEYAIQFGEINEGVLTHIRSADIQVLVKSMAEKDFAAVKQWCFVNQDVLHEGFYKLLYDTVEKAIEPQGIPDLVLQINDAQNHLRGVPDKFIHFLALATTIMMTVKFRPDHGN